MNRLPRPLPPVPPPLRGAEPDSFARDTLARRLPTIMRRVLSECTLTPAAAAAVAALAAELPNGMIRPLHDRSAPDCQAWDAYLAPYAGQSWLEIPWFVAETYAYRRLLEATGFFPPGRHAHIDPFALQKERGLAELTQLPDLASTLAEAIRGALWGNQADLSLWPAGESAGPGGAHLLADDTDAAVAHLQRLARDGRAAALILDNAGAELVHDLVLAAALIAQGMPVVLHAKAHPTFVSDATPADVMATLTWLAQRADGAALSATLQAALASGQAQLRSDWFWTSPLVGWEVPAALAQELATTGIIISKGDANYRRWMGDRPWSGTTPLGRVLAYAPAPLLLLRTCKSDVVIGLTSAGMAAAAHQDPQWRTNGRWGLIQFWAG